MTAEISIIIPSKNGKQHLADCLPTVCAAAAKSSAPVEIIVVDDNSEDGSVTFVKNTFKDVKIYPNTLRGASSARNYGVSKSSGKYILFIDNDVFLEENFFETALPHLSPDMFCAACCIYRATPAEGQREQLDGIKLIAWTKGFMRFTGNIYNDQLKKSSIYYSFCVQGATFFCSREKFDLLGGFDLLFEPYLLEESDLVYRGLKRGWKITYIPQVKPRHKCGGTINVKAAQKRTRALSKKNRILFVWKNIHDKSLLLYNLFWVWKTPLALYACIKMLPAIRKKRMEELALRKVTDSQLLKECKQYTKTITAK